jgi:hypothetical protein
MNAYIGWISFLVILIYHFTCEYFNRRERGRLLDRIMARNFAEFEYYDKKFVPDVKEVKALRQEAKDEREKLKAVDFIPTGYTTAREDPVEKFLKAYEEDWSADEIDRGEVQKILDKK